LSRSLKIASVSLIALLAASPLWALSAVDVTVTGTDEATAKSLQSKLEGASLTRTAMQDEVTDVGELVAAAKGEYKKMVSVLYGAGYYGPTVSVKIDGKEVAELSPFAMPKAVDKVTITVDPGPQFKFGTAEVTPREPSAAAKGKPVTTGFETGKVAESGLVGSAANAGIGEWREVGHPKAAVAGQEITANHKTDTLDATVTLDPGPKLRFGTLTVEGKTKVREKRIRDILGWPEGKTFSPERLNKSANRLRRTGTFKTVSLVEADTPNPDGTLDYTLGVIDQKPRQLSFGAEYSTLDGALLNAGWMHRNVFGGAENFTIDGEISNIGGTQGGGQDYSLDARLTRPATFGPDNEGFVFASASRDDEPDYLETQTTWGVGLTRYFNSKLLGEVAGGLRYSQADDAYGHRDFYHAVFPSSLEWDDRDNSGDPLKGIYTKLNLTPAFGLNGSQSFTQVKMDNRGYLSFASNRITLAGRVQIGSNMGADLEDVPPDFTFYSGGGDTVRGQSYKSLGVTLNDGDTVGGRSFLGLSGEIRTRMTDSLGLVAFYDYGRIGRDAFARPGDPDQSGVGIGLRYATPIGPIRMDLATPYKGNSTKFSHIDLYIGIGQAF